MGTCEGDVWKRACKRGPKPFETDHENLCAYPDVALQAVMQTFDREIAKHWKSLPGALPVCYLYEDDNACEPSNCGTDAAVKEMAAAGVEIIGPPLWGVVTSWGHTMGPSPRAAMLKEMSLGVTPWSLERSACPPRISGQDETPGPCGWFYTGLEGVSAFNYYDILLMSYTLLHEVNATGVFSDKPMLVTAMANCVPPILQATI